MKITREETFSVVSKTKGKRKSDFSVFKLVKETVLGKKYRLSLVFADSALSKRLNLRYRKRNKTPNVLSFPLSEKEGEIFISPETAKKESGKFGKSYRQFLVFLFIHGLLHLKGLTHGSKMESEERKFGKHFGV